ncbi:uncharacterized protein LOC119682570 isoform X2 [Teleopsis dalmanni]|uniref:uncharacterized protein LOC119682570 isoform X2 n=1 Tax=Teleopsis dalmanni TaxID=139649 RepID=UPI0018CE3051|nr:uncharacterized protein LOC119682570 isoform X2 [Teleopsis dalmanni]
MDSVSKKKCNTYPEYSQQYQSKRQANADKKDKLDDCIDHNFQSSQDGLLNNCNTQRITISTTPLPCDDQNVHNFEQQESSISLHSHSDTSKLLHTQSSNKFPSSILNGRSSNSVVSFESAVISSLSSETKCANNESMPELSPDMFTSDNKHHIFKHEKHVDEVIKQLQIISEKIVLQPKIY